MNEKEIIEMLDELAQLRAQADVLGLDKQAAIDSILTPSIRQQLADIEAEFADKAEAVNAKIAVTEKAVKGVVEHLGKSIRGEHLQAVFSKRTSWDTKALNGYAVVHPEVLVFKKESQSVSIRQVR